MEGRPGSRSIDGYQRARGVLGRGHNFMGPGLTRCVHGQATVLGGQGLTLSGGQSCNTSNDPLQVKLRPETARVGVNGPNTLWRRKIHRKAVAECLLPMCPGGHAADAANAWWIASQPHQQAFWPLFVSSSAGVSGQELRLAAQDRSEAGETLQECAAGFVAPFCSRTRKPKGCSALYHADAISYCAITHAAI